MLKHFSLSSLQQKDNRANGTINICCLKWGTKYSADYVNRLAAMVRRNLHKLHRFVCFTDDKTGIHPSIECLPIFDSALKGWWHKLSFFRPTLYDLKGTLLFLDLDLVIVSSLEPFFDHPGNFCAIRDWLSPNTLNSSVFRMEIGAYAHVYDNFLKFGPEKALVAFPSDQEWISQQISNVTPWPSSWCVSFKWQCALPRPDNPIIPDGAKIIVFHGKPDPHEAMNGYYPIYGPKHLVPQDNLRGSPASWIAKFWNVEGLEGQRENRENEGGISV